MVLSAELLLILDRIYRAARRVSPAPSSPSPTSSTLPAAVTPSPPPNPPRPGPLLYPPRYLHPEELELLKPTLVPSSAGGKPPSGDAADSASNDKNAADAAAAVAGEEKAVALVPSSRKEAAVRRRELLAYLREPLREACAANAGELMRSKFAGALVLLETVRVSERASGGFGQGWCDAAWCVAWCVVWVWGVQFVCFLECVGVGEC